MTRRSDDGWHRKQRTPADAERIRKYNGREHRQARAAGVHTVAAGQGFCWRPNCRQWIPPGTDWHVGHDDHDPTIIRGLEHARCNLSAAARKGNAIATAARRPPRQLPRSLPRW